jgi:hypothetical protein
VGEDLTATSTTNIATGATVSGATNTINVGTGGLAGSATSIAIGSTTGTSTTTLNGTVNASTLNASTGFLLGTDNVTGAVKWDRTTPLNPWFGVYADGAYRAISGRTPAPAGVASIGGYYSGMGIGGTTTNAGQPIFGVLNSSQFGQGLGVSAFTVLDTNKIVTFTNTLDDGSGNMIVAATTASTSTTTGALKVSGGVGIAGRLNVGGLMMPQQAASAPTYIKGAIYFDTTLNKLRVGGATGWETITSN